MTNKELVEYITKWAERRTLNAHEMPDNHPKKQYCLGQDDLICDLLVLLDNIEVEEVPSNVDEAEDDFKAGAEWSEEDETCLTNTLIMLKEYAIHHYSKDDVNRCVNWLENRAKFLCPLPKQEWSEEDEKMLQDIIDYISPMPLFFSSVKGTSGKEYTQKFMKRATYFLKERLKSLRPQPKQEWSEEDENNMKTIDSIIRHPSSIPLETYNTLIDWLKDLPNRFSLQPKQEWSEEDEKFISILIQRINEWYLLSEKICKYEDRDRVSSQHKDWLIGKIKSLRPQPHWKPSEEQMELLRYLAKWIDMASRERHILDSLIDNFKLM